MPFKSEAQRRACWAQYGRDKRAGRTPKWDCKEWEAETPKGKPLPYRVKSSMPSANVVYLAQQDLLGYSDKDLRLLAASYGLPTGISKRDTCWLIAIHNFMGK